AARRRHLRVLLIGARHLPLRPERKHQRRKHQHHRGIEEEHRSSASCGSPSRARHLWMRPTTARNGSLRSAARAHQLSGICKSPASAARPVRVHCSIQTRPPEAPLKQPIIDLRSDTVTRPTAAMRRAMAEAEVGDDVFGDDLTTQALERRVSELAGKPAALFVPSGTMGNQLAVHGHTTPGDEVLLDAMSHIALYEQGGMAANSGAMPRMVRTERGVMPASAIAETIRDH